LEEEEKMMMKITKMEKIEKGSSNPRKKEGRKKERKEGRRTTEEGRGNGGVGSLLLDRSYLLIHGKRKKEEGKKERKEGKGRSEKVNEGNMRKGRKDRERGRMVRR
jgi:hypothetical protein